MTISFMGSSCSASSFGLRAVPVKPHSHSEFLWWHLLLVLLLPSISGVK